jgi:hypothetical protein
VKILHAKRYLAAAHAEKSANIDDDRINVAIFGQKDILHVAHMLVRGAVDAGTDHVVGADLLHVGLLQVLARLDRRLLLRGLAALDLLISLITLCLLPSCLSGLAGLRLCACGLLLATGSKLKAKVDLRFFAIGLNDDGLAIADCDLLLGLTLLAGLLLLLCLLPARFGLRGLCVCKAHH